MNLGFFDEEDTPKIKRGDEKKKSSKPRESKKIGCEACGRQHDCKNPKMGIQGDGKKKILIILDEPGATDDKTGKYLSGTSGKKISGIINTYCDLKKDCWTMAAVQCYSDKEIKGVSIKACANKVQQAIKDLRPDVVITLGKIAIDSVVDHKMTGRLSVLSITDWAGCKIPDQEYNAYVCPTYNPKVLFTDRDELDAVMNRQIHSHIYNAISLVNNYFFFTHNYLSDVMVIKDVEEAISLLRTMQEKKHVAFDYETTGIKPYREGHKIKSVSVSDGLFAYSFPFFDDEDFRAEWKKFLLSDVSKIAHNAKYEMLWTKNRAGVGNKRGYWPKNIIACTMLTAHVINNKKKTNLKFLTYVNFGVAGYDSAIDQYLEASSDEKEKYGANAINRIDEAPLDDLLKYGGLDSLFTYKIWEAQKKDLIPSLTKKGADFFLDSIKELAKTENTGLLLDSANAEIQYKKITKKMERAEYAISICDEMKKWDKPNKFRPSAPADLTHLLFDCLKIKANKDDLTPTGKPKGDVEALEKYDNDIVKEVLKWRKLKKARDTYLGGFIREASDSVIHTSLNLHTVDTYRSCVAKGSLVLMAGDYINNPNGVPIEKIKAGDIVYCFNSKLELVLKKVIWAGKTGHKKVIRIHYNGATGNKGYLDVTPEHRIRVITGEYVRADELLEHDYRNKNDPKWKYKPKVCTLSCHRKGDRLFSTNNKELLEHRVVYEYFSGTKLNASDVIHHLDSNHLNHAYSNLEKTNLSSHSLLHYSRTIGTIESRIKNKQVIKQLHASGGYTHIYKCGKENAKAIVLSKDECLQYLSNSGGKPSKIPIDFYSFKRNCKDNGIDLKFELSFYSEIGEYLTADRIYNALKNFGFSAAQKELAIGYYRLKRLCIYYNIDYVRGFSNHLGVAVERIVTMNNHVITKLEYLPDSVDVYDIEVEDEHNFIANEICVHNSSNDPNLQNIPARDAEVMNLLRKLLIARPNHKLGEYDYKAMEAVIIAVYNQDPNWIKYVSDVGNDMHRDMAAKLVIKKKEEVSKDERQIAKNGFVFPTVYTSYWKNTAKNMWDMYSPETLAHLKSKGIKNLEDYRSHVKKVEKWFWEDQFPVGFEWMNKAVHDYNITGYVTLLSGFKCYGPMSRAQVINTPIQGTASHCKLWTLNQVSKLMEKKKMNSKILLEIHDSIIPDIDPAEEDYLDYIIWLYGTQKIREYWDWLIVPLFLEKKISAVNGNWAEMENRGLLRGER